MLSRCLLFKDRRRKNLSYLSSLKLPVLILLLFPFRLIFFSTKLLFFTFCNFSSISNIRYDYERSEMCTIKYLKPIALCQNGLWIYLVISFWKRNFSKASHSLHPPQRSQIFQPMPGQHKVSSRKWIFQPKPKPGYLSQ